MLNGVEIRRISGQEKQVDFMFVSNFLKPFFVMKACVVHDCGVARFCIWNVAEFKPFLEKRSRCRMFISLRSYRFFLIVSRNRVGPAELSSAFRILDFFAAQRISEISAIKFIASAFIDPISLILRDFG